MKTVQVHRFDRSDNHISEYYWNVVTDIDTDDRVMRLFGLRRGYAMEKIGNGIYENQYGEAYIVVRDKE